MKNNNLHQHSLPGIVKGILLFTVVMFSLMPSRAADYYWVGGSGNWSDYAGHWATSSGGNIFHTSIPTLNDDVFFDAASFQSAGGILLIDNTLIYCKNLDFTGVQFNPTVNGLANTLNVYGSLTLVPAMTWSVKRINLLSADPGNTITSAGKMMDTLYFNGAGAYALNDDVNAKSIFISNGTFVTNNHSLQVQKFYAGDGTATPAVDLGTSTITCNDDFRAYYGTINLVSSNADLLFNNAINNRIYFWSNGHTFNNITFNSRAEVIGSFNCNNLIATNIFHINSSVATSTVITADFSGSIILDCIFYADTLRMLNPGLDVKVRQLFINDEFTANGICGQPVQIMPIDFLANGIITKTSGQVTLDYIILTAINATGGATFTANNSIDAGNNAGWIINASAPRTLYWVGGTGSWNDESHWSQSSGGTGGVCIPASVDNVIFDAASFNQPGDTVLISSPAVCNNMNWTGVVNAPVFTKDFLTSFRIFGSLTLSPGMIFNIDQVQFSGSSTGNTIFTAGLQIPGILINASGSWSLSDELHCGGIQIFQGTLSTNDHDIYAGSFAPNGIGSSINVDLGSSTLYISGNYMGFDGAINLNSANASLEFFHSGGTQIYCQLSDDQFNNVTILSNTYVSGKLTCNDFIAQASLHVDNLVAVNATFDQSFTARSIEADNMILNSGVHSMSIDTLIINVNLTSGNLCNSTLSVQPYVTAPAQIIQNSGTLTFNYTYINNVTASGGATFTANNSWDLGNNTGFTFNTPLPRDLYWVGGTGAWIDNAHWSSTSGGSGGNCPPGPSDNVFFDINSFSQSNDTVHLFTTMNMYCNNMQFSGVPSNTVLWSGSSRQMFVKGSLTFTPEVNPYVNIEMTSPLVGTTITSAGNYLGSLRINGTGTFELTDELLLGNFAMSKGVLNTNNFNINTGDINFGGSSILNLGTSQVTVLGFYSNSGTINGANADIIMNSSFLGLEVNNGFFNSVTFTGAAHTQNNFGCNRLYAMGPFTDINSQITAGYAEFHDNVTLANSFTADSIMLANPGKIVRISQINLNEAIVSNGTSGFPIQIESVNGSAIITKVSGQVCLDYVLLKDIQATGGAQFFAGINSVDLGGNAGWLFSSCIPPVTDVWPGDANYDLVADNNDILNIGLAYGFSGPVRTGATLAWMAQPAQDWSFQFANTANLKHADTDGNGVINDDDTLAISLNYGLTHLRIQPPVVSQLPNPVLYIETNPDTAYLSDTIDVNVFLGTSLLPVDSIYGIAFTVNFDTALIDTSFLELDFTGCWMGTQQLDLLTFSKNKLGQGSVDMAIVRTDQQNINGFGFLTRLGIVIVDNVGAKITMPVTLSDVKAITAAEYPVTISFANDSVVIDTTLSTGIQQLDISKEISFYPNPANQQLFVNAGNIEITQYQIYNQFGVLVGEGNPGISDFKIPTQSLSQGLYIIHLVSREGIAMRKFEVIRR